MNITYAGSLRTAELQRIVGELAIIYLEPVGIVCVEKTKLIGVEDGKRQQPTTKRQAEENESEEEKGC